jgi:hypothetical protein
MSESRSESFGQGQSDPLSDFIAKQSPHDPAKLEACPHCGAPSTMSKDLRGRPERLHRVSRGEGRYGYDSANHSEDKK